MTQADRVLSTPPTNTPVDPTRRGFLSTVASVAAGSAALAVVPMAPLPAKAAERVSDSILAAMDDSALLKLEKLIFEQYEGATAYDDEINRLHQVWTAEYKRLFDETDLTQDQRHDLVGEMPECKEHTRLARLQDPFYERMDVLVKEMFATPAKTSEGRRAKVTVLLGVIMGHGWQEVDKDTDYPERMARSLLIELVGGQPAEMLRDQFA